MAKKSGTPTGLETIFFAISSVSPQAPRCDRPPPASTQLKARALMAASAAAVEFRRPAEFGGDDDQRLIQQPLLFQIRDQRRDGGVQLLDQLVLLEDALVVDIPAGAVEEVQVVRHFDESHAALDQSAAQQAALAELAAVSVSQVGRFAVQLEDAIELRAAQFQTLLDRPRRSRAIAGRSSASALRFRTSQETLPAAIAVAGVMPSGRDSPAGPWLVSVRYR